MSKYDRADIIRKFKQGGYKCLISTDLLSRGIDIQQVGVVINFDLPKDVHNYLHRIGRSGRFGKRGVAINLITRKEYGRVKELERYYHTTIAELPEDIKKKLEKKQTENEKKNKKGKFKKKKKKEN